MERRLTLLMVAGMLVTLLAGFANAQTLDERFQKSLQAELKAWPAISGEIVPDPDEQPVLPPMPLEPVPDPAFELQPLIEYLPAAGTAQASRERLPRGLLLVAKYCQPCERMKTENAELIGGPDSPIELLNVSTDAERFHELGLRMDSLSCPVLVVIDAAGKIHGLAADGKSFGCSLAGYQPRARVIDYLTKSDHGVNVDRAEPQELAAAAVVSNVPKSIDTLAAAVAWHVLQDGQTDQTFSAADQTFGSLLNFNVDVPDPVLDITGKILNTQTISFPAAGVSLDWSGATRTISVARGRVEFSPAVAMTVRKWRIEKSCRLDAITFTDDLAAVTFELTGMVDITVNLN